MPAGTMKNNFRLPRFSEKLKENFFKKSVWNLISSLYIRGLFWEFLVKRDERNIIAYRNPLPQYICSLFHIIHKNTPRTHFFEVLQLKDKILWPPHLPQATFCHIMVLYCRKSEGNHLVHDMGVGECELPSVIHTIKKYIFQQLGGDVHNCDRSEAPHSDFDRSHTILSQTWGRHNSVYHFLVTICWSTRKITATDPAGPVFLKKVAIRVLFVLFVCLDLFSWSQTVDWRLDFLP